MLFSTPFFLFAFLPAFLVIYWLLPLRRPLLLLGSLFFYAWSEPLFLLVVLASSVADYVLGIGIVGSDQVRLRKVLVAVGVLLNLGVLVYAKYAAFAVENLDWLLAHAGMGTFAVPQVALPLGVSFIVFEKITYLVDLYRRVAKPAASWLDYLNYVFLFPKLLAGPIVKYHDISAQLTKPSHRYEDIRDGTCRFLQGLGKKVLIADTLAPFVDQAFKLPASSLESTTAWCGLIAFTLQIYFDFSGYSDMAIGLGRLLGFRLLENFNCPYLATSFTDFWRRWHISLSSWIKEYLYWPLGGSRASPLRGYRNLVICFLLSGLWHGASWHFVAWGSFHGLMLVAERSFWLEWQRKLPRLVNIAITLSLVVLSWTLFRCETLGHALGYLRALFASPATAPDFVFVQKDSLIAMIVGAAMVFMPLLTARLESSAKAWRPSFALAGAFVILLACSGRIAVTTFHPFLYFRF